MPPGEEGTVCVGDEHKRQHHSVCEMSGYQVNDLGFRCVTIRGQADEVLFQYFGYFGLWHETLHEGPALASEFAPEFDEDSLVTRLCGSQRIGPARGPFEGSAIVEVRVRCHGVGS